METRANVIVKTNSSEGFCNRACQPNLSWLANNTADSVYEKTNFMTTTISSKYNNAGRMAKFGPLGNDLETSFLRFKFDRHCSCNSTNHIPRSNLYCLRVLSCIQHSQNCAFPCTFVFLLAYKFYHLTQSPLLLSIRRLTL